MNCLALPCRRRGDGGHHHVLADAWLIRLGPQAVVDLGHELAVRIEVIFPDAVGRGHLADGLKLDIAGNL